MITLKQRRAYTEVLAVLEELKLTNSIPNNLLETMRREKDESWDFSFNKDILLEKQLLTKTGAELLSVIYLNFICDNLEEKNKLKKIYEENELKYAPKNNLSEVIKKKEDCIENNNFVEIKNKENILPIKKEKLIDKIKKIFLICFRK